MISTTPEIEELKRERDCLEKQLHKLDLEITEKTNALCPAKIGDLVEKDGLVYKVSSIRQAYREWWLRGHKRLKNGHFGTQTRQLFGDWSLISEQEKSDEPTTQTTARP